MVNRLSLMVSLLPMGEVPSRHSCSMACKGSSMRSSFSRLLPDTMPYIYLR